MEKEKPIVKEKKFTLSTKKGSWRLFALLVAIMLLFALLSNVISTGFYSVQRSRVTFDVRGADVAVEIWRPVNVSSKDKLPAVMLSHGGSEMLGCTSLYAWELARRGFVVINENMNGAGMNGQPNIDESGFGTGTYSRAGAAGHLDILNYVRTITYVDTSRISMWGHSQGNGTQGTALRLDGLYYTLNDRMLNILNSDYGIAITKEQISQNADDIAKKVLTPYQLGEYNQKKVEQKQVVDGYVHFARAAGANTKVKVAGIEVVRDAQCNFMPSIGAHESAGLKDPETNARYTSSFHLQKGEKLVVGGIYNVPDNTLGTNYPTKYLGNIFDITVQNSPEFKEAVQHGTARFYNVPQTIHNGWLWGYAAVSQSIEFICQSLQYNCGELSDPTTQPISGSNMIVGYTTLVFTTLALFAMIGMLMCLCSILLKTEFFAPCAFERYAAKMPYKSKNMWIWVAATTAVGFIGMWFCSLENFAFTTSINTMYKILPWEPAHIRIVFHAGGTALAGVLVFFLLSKLFKKNKPEEPVLATLQELHVKAGWSRVLKTFLLGFILFAAAYLSACFIDVFFETRFLHVDGSYEVMQAYNFGRMFRYFILFLPFCLVVSTLNNMVTIKGISEAKDTTINVLVTTLGMILFMGIGFLVTYSEPGHAQIFSIHSMLSMIFIVPYVNYIYRKMFKLTGSVWAGAILVALFLAWRAAGYLCQRFMWYGNNEVAAFWGLYF
ncbi:MAG: hypothetical protein AB9828_07850 [Sphaerochaetaceae bacterium]